MPEKQYIEREAVLRRMQKIATEAWKMRIKANVETVWNEAQDVLRFFPAADVRPVVRGHWISEEEAEEKGDYSLRDACSVCGHCDWDCTESESFNYCPNCGARMERKGVMKSAIWQVGGSRGPTFRSYEDAVAYIRTRYGSLRNVFLRKIEDKEREGEEKNEKVL